MHDLFGERHDPGGKSKSRILPGVVGDAVFAGDRQQYRPLLRRWKGDAFPREFVLFCGMNPSVATAEFNDPTIAAEWRFTERWRYSAMAKVNVADYRLTDPKMLATIEEPLWSDLNVPTILEMANKAALIVMVHGNLPKPLRAVGDLVTSELRRIGVPLHCFQRNADGSPKHSLYVKGGQILSPY